MRSGMDNFVTLLGAWLYRGSGALGSRLQLHCDWKNLDWTLLSLIVIMISIGVVMNTSASLYYMEKNFGDAYLLFGRQLVYLLIGIVIVFLVVHIPSIFWYKSSFWLLVVSLVLLALVVVPEIGVEVNGSRRWIRMPLGHLTFQVAEVVKATLIVFVAGYIVRHREELKDTWWDSLKPLLIVVVLAALLFIQPDLGSIVVLFIITMGLLFLAGTRWLLLLLLMGLGIGCLAWLIVSKPYMLGRLVDFLAFDPWDDPFDRDFQLVQSLIAYGQGSWFGVGLGNSVQKLKFLPEAHTDFIFAIIAEELGFIGAALILCIIMFTLGRILVLGKGILSAKLRYQGRDGIHTQDQHALFCGYCCFGVTIFLACQSFINIAMTLGGLPTKGLTLPFISYGGSSLLICCFLIALVLRISMEFKVAEKEASIGESA